MIRNGLYGFYSANMFLTVRVWLETLGKESGTGFCSFGHCLKVSSEISTCS